MPDPLAAPLTFGHRAALPPRMEEPLFRLVAGNPSATLDKLGEAKRDRFTTAALAAEAVLVLGSAREHLRDAHDLLV